MQRTADENARVPLCCVHCAQVDNLSSFFSETSAGQPKKIGGNVLLLN